MVRLNRKKQSKDYAVVAWSPKEHRLALEWKLNKIFGESYTIGEKTYRVFSVISDDFNEIYVKMIYEGDIYVSNLNDLYTDMHEKLNDIGYNFYGICEYKGNKEVCVYYKREEK